jgi:YgiT-type zinc finger domain-containing protein
MTDLIIKICQTCVSNRVRRVKRDIESRRGSERFTARGIEIEECPVCGERLFSPETLEEIVVQKPHTAKRIRKRKSV